MSEGGDDQREPTTSPVGPTRAAAAADRREAQDRERAEGRLSERGEIGRGGQGVVRKMFDKHLKRYVALKVMDRALSTHPDERQRFIEEARITGQLDHPNIVPI